MYPRVGAKAYGAPGRNGAHWDPKGPRGPWDTWGRMGSHGQPWGPRRTHGYPWGPWGTWGPWGPTGPMGTHRAHGHHGPLGEFLCHTFFSRKHTEVLISFSHMWSEKCLFGLQNWALTTHPWLNKRRITVLAPWLQGPWRRRSLARHEPPRGGFRSPADAGWPMGQSITNFVFWEGSAQRSRHLAQRGWLRGLGRPLYLIPYLLPYTFLPFEFWIYLIPYTCYLIPFTVYFYTCYLIPFTCLFTV